MSMFAIMRPCSSVRLPMMHKFIPTLLLLAAMPATAQMPGEQLSDLPKPHDYVLKRSSSYDRTGGNADARQVAPGDAITVLDEAWPGEISHICFTIPPNANYHLNHIPLP